MIFRTGGVPPSPPGMSSDILPLLKRVSRSFYLSLWLLPESVRPTLSLAYLLARASDSVADASSAPADLRLRLLRTFPQSLPDGTVLPGPLPDGERELLDALPDLLRRLDSSPDRTEILEVWQTILGGQIFDLQRFSSASAPLDLDEAVRYTGLVAGCVGKFWTQVCFRHIPGYSDESPGTMCGLGFDFGCGLQWVNILRDRHADAAAGRIYVTDGNFSAAMDIARKNLAAGVRYTAAVRPRRLRAACRLPLDLGIRTLALVAANPRAPHIKTGRAFVWFSLVRALCH